MTSDRQRAHVGGPKSRPAEFRRAIEQAEAEGVSKDDLVLCLTLSDTADLKRDPSIPIHDISFSEGVMRFLGVKVAPGGVTSSTLQRPQAPAAE